MERGRALEDAGVVVSSGLRAGLHTEPAEPGAGSVEGVDDADPDSVEAAHLEVDRLDRGGGDARATQHDGGSESTIDGLSRAAAIVRLCFGLGPCRALGSAHETEPTGREQHTRDGDKGEERKTDCHVYFATA